MKRSWMAGRSRRAVRRAFARDMRRYVRHAMTTKATKSRENLEALILMSAHSLEKGLSLAEPRPLFGLPTVRLLMTLTEEYVTGFGADWVVACAVATLQAYVDFHGDHQDGKLDPVRGWLTVHAEWNRSQSAGVRTMKGEPLRAGGRTPGEFLKTRYSVRHYSERPVERDRLAEAFEIALKAPSVCNRQAWRVKCIRDPSLIERIQKIAGGARGFGERISALLIVTCDLRCSHGASERNQAWVDGGIYAMSLLYALHAQGLAACCLNCCLKPAEELELRRLLQLPDAEVLITRISVGHYPDEFRVAVSPRRALEDVVRWYEPTHPSQGSPS